MAAQQAQVAVADVRHVHQDRSFTALVRDLVDGRALDGIDGAADGAKDHGGGAQLRLYAPKHPPCHIGFNG